MRLNVFIEDALVGILQHDAATNQFAFDYAQAWASAPTSFPLAPKLPLEPDGALSAEHHSRIVRSFFENLLPEGQALDDVAAAYTISKANTIGLIAIMGQETAGALRIVRGDAPFEAHNEEMRLVTPKELSARIIERPQLPFTIWDQKVRLSIAGYQDKIAVYQDEADQWFLVAGSRYASTHILKPEPQNPHLAGLTSNEFFCMRLAKAIGLPVADVRLHHVPQPLLSVKRFDRHTGPSGVRRIPAIDGCQALGLATLAKYERPYGSTRDVKDIRTGASLPALFRVLKYSAQPVVERLQLLRWAIFQVLIGNTDAHAKNLTFFNDLGGLRMAPAYDMVSGLVYAESPIEDTFAMAIGDAFTVGELSTYEWLNMAELCELPPALVQKELTVLSKRALAELEATCQNTLAEGAVPSVVGQVAAIVQQEATRQVGIAAGIATLAKDLGA